MLTAIDLEFYPTFVDSLPYTWHFAWHQEDGVNKTWSLTFRSLQTFRRRETFEQIITVTDYLYDYKGKVVSSP